MAEAAGGGLERRMSKSVRTRKLEYRESTGSVVNCAGKMDLGVCAACDRLLKTEGGTI